MTHTRTTIPQHAPQFVRAASTNYMTEDDLLNTHRTASILLFVYLGITTDACLEAVREFRKIPLFQRHEGKRRLNQLRDALVAADNRICSVARSEEYVDYLEDVKSAFVGPIEADIAKYRYTVANIVGRTEFPYIEAYAYGVVAQSIAHLTAQFEEESVFGYLSKPYMLDGQLLRISTDKLALFRRYGTKDLEAALTRCTELFDKDTRINAHLPQKTDSDVNAISNGARIIVDRLTDLEKLVTIAQVIAKEQYADLLSEDHS